ncbi:hypothetical protein [Parvicella tangerina]|uniref:hypothetical protein n=1 Tax=Parvicella tangerina TaxID=2829795 RepID=UPI00215B805E|nr:hypothetical protein [Parvicella tangerina]
MYRLIGIKLKRNSQKYGLLIISLFLDFVGMLTYSIPLFGEVFDLIWAPISAALVWVMYRKPYGAIGGLFSFFEEILPGGDVAPTFTVMWLVKYYVVRDKNTISKATLQ